MFSRKRLSPFQKIQQAQVKVMNACIEAISTELTTTDMSRVRDILNQTINDWDSLEPIIWEPITQNLMTTGWEIE